MSVADAWTRLQSPRRSSGMTSKILRPQQHRRSIFNVLNDPVRGGQRQKWGMKSGSGGKAERPVSAPTAVHCRQ